MSLPAANQPHFSMPFVVTEPCILCKHTDCVDVCPMDCFVEGPNFLAIDPETCIDCSLCVAECPVDAIIDASEATEAQRPFILLNAQLAKNSRWTPITRSKAPLPDHEAWGRVAAKVHLLENAPLSPLTKRRADAGHGPG